MKESRRPKTDRARRLDQDRRRGTQRAYDYLVEFNPRAAMHVAETLRDEGNGLVIFPHRGRLVPGTNMRELVTSYPYIILSLHHPLPRRR